MLENLYTTKMSMDKKKLQNRFTKIRSKNGRISKLMALIIFAVILLVMACVSIIIAANMKSDEYIMTENEFSDYINRPIGAVMADINYADENKIVFHYAEGFFIDNLQTEEIDYAINLEKLDIAYNQQGSSVLEIKVDKGGKYAYLSTVGPADEIKDYEKYIVNLENGEVKKGAMPENAELFTGIADTFTTVQNPVGWFSNNCIVSDDKIYYLTSEIGAVNGMQLITVNKTDGEIKHKYIFGENYVSPVSQVAEYTPAEIKDIINVELVADGIKYPIATENAHLVIEKDFSSATKIAMGETDCPFNAELIFTRADGQKGYVTIATDSCAVFKSGDTYYDYGEDNSILLSYFGLEWNDLMNKSYIENAEITVRNFFTAFEEPDFETMKSLATREFIADGYIDDGYAMCYGMTKATLDSCSKANVDEFLNNYLAKPEHTQFTLSKNDIELLKAKSDKLAVYTVVATAESNIKGKIQPPFKSFMNVICKKQDNGSWLVHKLVN